MATQTFTFDAEPGLTLTARLYPVGSNSAFAVATSCTEAARGGVYSFTQVNTAGRYEVHLVDTVAAEALGVLYTPLTANTTTTYALVSEPILIAIAEDAEDAANNGGGGGGGLSFVVPLVSSTVERITRNRIDLYSREAIPLELPIYDSAGEPVDCTGLTCELLFGEGTLIADLEPAAVGASVPYVYSCTPTADLTARDRVVSFALRVQDATHHVLAEGSLRVSYAP